MTVEIKDLSVSKTNVECYKVRHSKGGYYADITIGSGDRSGRIQISSDFGDWSYYWGATGCDFKDFLIKLNIGYCADKFGCGRWFDVDKTVNLYYNQIIEVRKQEQIEAAYARELWNQVEELNDCIDENSFIHVMWNQHELMSFMDNQPEMIRDISPHFKRFWDTLWQAFINELKNEKAL